VVAALSKLVREGKVEAAKVKQAMADFEIDPEKIDPVRA
jgi:pyruvate dehydrogenase complex dehydrogenase (E1) component